MTVLLCVNSADGQSVKIVPKEQERRIDVEIDGRPFTSYRWDEPIRRPVLLPIMTAGGAFLTRGFPVETRGGETVGHPHQVGLSLSYGDVNGFDFWNNSPFRTPKELEKMGRIEHRKIVKMKSGKNRGELVTESNWVLPDGKVILTENTKYIFQAEGSARRIDRETTLTAKDERVIFGDNKEGLFAVHLTRELQQKDQTKVRITDAKGNISVTETNENLTGEYFNSEALAGDKIWGTRGRWAAVRGKIGTEELTVAVFDHPENHNFPSAMMVRGYGLLALNPFGQKAFDAKAEPRKFVLAPNRSLSFRHRLLIQNGKAAPETVEKEYEKFIK